jgi:hypothetical protein
MARLLKESAARLKIHPLLGVAVADLPFRDLIIPFGASGYPLRYRVIRETQTVVLVGIRHAPGKAIPPLQALPDCERCQ